MVRGISMYLQYASGGYRGDDVVRGQKLGCRSQAGESPVNRHSPYTIRYTLNLRTGYGTKRLARNTIRLISYRYP